MPALGLGLVARSFAADADPFAPTVSREEADLLQRAVEMSFGEPAAAAEALRAGIGPERSAALDFALANFRFQDGDLSGAEAAYREAIRKHPRFRNALNNLGRLYLMQDRPRDAQEVFQDLLRDGQSDADGLRLLGYSLLQQDRAVSAEGAFRQALVLAPDDGDAMRGLIKCLIEQGRMTEMLVLTRELIRRQPDDGELWQLAANAHLTEERFDDAVVAIETARVLGQASPGLLATLGDLYLNREQPHDAVEAYREAFAGLDPDADHVLQAVEGMVVLGAVHEAAGLMAGLDGQVLTPAQDQRHRRLTARLAASAGDVETAVRTLADVLERYPLDGDAMIELAELRIDKEAWDDARMWLERAGRIDGFEARARVVHAQLEVAQERYAAAVGLLEEAQAFESRPAVARYLEQVRRLATQGNFRGGLDME